MPTANGKKVFMSMCAKMYKRFQMNRNIRVIIEKFFETPIATKAILREHVSQAMGNCCPRKVQDKSQKNVQRSP
jgi:glucose-6-phosphate 1-dehydrogenase